MVHEFADCRVGPASRELHRAGRAVEFQPRVDLLLYLIEHRDRVAGRR